MKFCIKHIIYTMLLLLIFSSCSKEPTTVAIVNTGDIQVNPYGYAPLTAALDVHVEGADVTATTVIKARNENEKDLTIQKVLSPSSESQLVPVMGLYPNSENIVLFSFSDQSGKVLKELTDTLYTDQLPFEFNEPPVVSGTLNPNEMIFTILYTAFNLSSAGLGTLEYTQYAVLFDGLGNIRWYSDFAGRDHSVFKIIDGYLFAGSSNGMHVSELIKYSMLGEELEVYDFSIYGPRDGFENIHHDIQQTTDGTLLLTVNGIDHPSIENFIIEIDPSLQSNTIQTVIDLEEILPNVDDLFPDLPQSYAPGKTDAIHNNGIYPSPDGKSLLVSSQRSGLAKINLNTGTLRWYLFSHKVQAAPGISKQDYDPEPLYDNNGYPMPHPTWRSPANGDFPSEDYQLAGGFNYKKFLLHPLDASGDTIKNEMTVWEGQTGTDFSFPYRQHSPVILQNNNILVFDNGYIRDFIPLPSFSRVIEYRVSEDNSDGYGGTVQQVWEYIPGTGNEYFSPVAGSVNELENGNRLVCFGSAGFKLSHDLTPEQMLALSQHTKAFIAEVTPDNPPEEVFTLQLNTKSIGLTATGADIVILE